MKNFFEWKDEQIEARGIVTNDIIETYLRK